MTWTHQSWSYCSEPVFAEKTDEFCSSAVPQRNTLLFILAPEVLDTLTTAPQFTGNDKQVIGQQTSSPLISSLLETEKASEIQKLLGETVLARKI